MAVAQRAGIGILYLADHAVAAQFRRGLGTTADAVALQITPCCEHTGRGYAEKAAIKIFDPLWVASTIGIQEATRKGLWFSKQFHPRVASPCRLGLPGGIYKEAVS